MDPLSLPLFRYYRSHVQLIDNRGVVAVAGADKEITEDDVERVPQAAKVIALLRTVRLSMLFP